MNSEFIGPVLNCAHNIFTAYYVQAISLFGNAGNINVIKTLDRLNPNRKPDESGFLADVFKNIATESLDRVEPISVFGFNGNNIKLPSYGLENNKNNSNNDDDKFVQHGKLSSKSLSTVNELSNLAVGKLIEVTLSDQGISITVPLAIRLIPNELPLSPMLKLLSLHNFDRTFVERFWK